MSTIQDCLLEAMNQVAEANSAKSTSTQTVDCEIVEVVDAGVGLYKVKYLENIFTVYSNNISNTYSIGDIVCVLVPMGDFSRQKFIIGISSPSAKNYSLATEDNYLSVSDNIFGDVTYESSNVIELCSFNSSEKELNIGNQHLNSILANYLQNYKVLSMKCNIKTNLPKEQQVGAIME